MIIDNYDLIKGNENSRVIIKDGLRKEIDRNLNENEIINLSQRMKISPISLKRKIENKKGYSFLIRELISILSYIDIEDCKLKKNIEFFKIGHCAKWIRPFKTSIDKDFVAGIGYYIGDGRTKTNRGLSTVNKDAKIAKFFINWLIKYFDVNILDMKIYIKTNKEYQNKRIIRRKYSKLIGIDEKCITSISKKYNARKNHKNLIEVYINRVILKNILNSLVPKVKEICLEDKELAIAYVRGLMAAEGCPRHNRESGSRNVFIKMKNKKEIEFAYFLLNNVIHIKTSNILFSKQDEEWLITISGIYELEKLHKIDIFGMNSERAVKFDNIMSSYKRKQTKKGDVSNFYMKKISELKHNNPKITALQLSNYIGRDKTRTIYVLRNLERNGYLMGNRVEKVGRPFEFSITEKGEKLINELAESF